jgi:long-chain acyl-CoA synthetase
MTMEVAELMAQLRERLTAPGSLFETVEQDVRGETMSVFRHRARSLRELLEASSRFEDRLYLVDGDVRLSFKEHLAHVDAVALRLQEELRVQPGERVALFCANHWEWVVCYSALVSLGAIPAAFNGWWTPDEFAHAARLVEPVLIIGDEERLERVVASGTLIPSVAIDEVVTSDRPTDARRPVLPVLDEDQPAVLIFTSGTTGPAKAVTVPHRALVGFAQLSDFPKQMVRVAMGEATPQPGETAPPSDDVVLVTSPLFHTSMLNGVVLLALSNGSAFVLLPGRFDPDRVLATIEREGVTTWLALGSAGPRVAASDAVGRYDTSSIRYIGVGGAPVSPAVQDGLRAAFPSAKDAMGMGYTSTEGGAVIASIGGPEFQAHPTSTGRVSLTTELELRDAEGRAVAEGEAGEVHVRSPYLMLGYWNDPEATNEALKPGGWLAMGDVARLENGLLYIDSRARDMILVSAENVSPTEVEACLEAHPDVLEAAVFAVDDALTGDAVCAVVKPHAGSDVDTEALTAWCRGRLAHYKVPTHCHLSEEPLLRTPTGKLLKQALRARFERATSSV